MSNPVVDEIPRYVGDEFQSLVTFLSPKTNLSVVISVTNSPFF